MVFMGLVLNLSAHNNNIDTVNFKNVRVEKSYSSTGFDFFDGEKPLKITLTFDVRGFIRTKENPENYDADITIITDEGDSLTQDIKVKVRGKMRRIYCSFPPMMLKFRDKGGDVPILNQGNIKLVTHCEQSFAAESYVLKEYLAYKLYNMVTPYSFKTRLAEVEYKDVKTGKSIHEFGFIIESVDQLAQRNNSMIVSNPNISQKHMDDYEMTRVAFFNYMIGNTDWNITNQHNVKVLRNLNINAEKGIPVIYDFDYSGFVDASYSTPPQSLPITCVTDRYYMGGCISSEIVAEVYNEFAGKREQFLNSIENCTFLSKSKRIKAEKYINSFYKKFKTDDLLLSEVTRYCRNQN
jgi:hypothetical protein